MKTLTQLIKEQNENKEFKYTVNVKLSGYVIAPNEGDAGELVDKEMDVVGENFEDFSYEIELIEETDKKDITNESVSYDEISQIIVDDILESYKDKIKDLPKYYQSIVKETLKYNL